MKLYNKDCLEVLPKLKPCSIDLTLTSPPYDNLRSYSGHGDRWNRDVWQEVISELFRITKPGGVVVWVVGDATVRGSETGSSFKQALWAMECGFSLYDTMIYHKHGLVKNHNRYEQEFEYMFIFSKGKPKVFNGIRVPTSYPEKKTARKNSYFSHTNEQQRSARSGAKRKPVGTDKIKGNVWYYRTGGVHSTSDSEAYQHPATFPEQLAHDHIVSWSNPGDVVFDPFLGSGTSGKIARQLGRDFIGCEIDSDYFKIAKARVYKKTAIPEQRHHGLELGYQCLASNCNGTLTGDYETVFTDTSEKRPELKKLLQAVKQGCHVTVNSFSEIADNMDSLLKTVKHIIAKGGSIEFIQEQQNFDSEESLALFESLNTFRKQAARDKLERGIEKSVKKNGRPSQFTKSQMKTMVRQAKKIDTPEQRKKFCEKHGISRPYSYKLAKMDA